MGPGSCLLFLLTPPTLQLTSCALQGRRRLGLCLHCFYLRDLLHVHRLWHLLGASLRAPSLGLQTPPQAPPQVDQCVRLGHVSTESTANSASRFFLNSSVTLGFSCFPSSRWLLPVAPLPHLRVHVPHAQVDLPCFVWHHQLVDNCCEFVSGIASWPD